MTAPPQPSGRPPAGDAPAKDTPADRARGRSGATGDTRPASPADPLVDRLRSGDPDACQEMIERHAAAMLRSLLRLRGDRFDAEDVLQETWIQACLAVRGFRGEASLRTWLDRIASNAAAMAERRRLALSRGAGKEELPLGVLVDGSAGAGGSGVLVEPATPGDAESAVIWRETLAELSEGVARLGPGLREVFVLRDLQGASTQETARELGISEDAVKQRLHRARTRLRGALAHLAGEPSLVTR